MKCHGQNTPTPRKHSKFFGVLGKRSPNFDRFLELTFLFGKFTLLTDKPNQIGNRERKSTVKNSLSLIVTAFVLLAILLAPAPAAAQTLKNTKVDMNAP